MTFEQMFRPPFKLSLINEYASRDPVGFLEESDALYNARVRRAADMIAENRKNSPIVLLSGPSGSGKTTTAKKIEEELEKRGIRTHTISMDDYFRSRDRYQVPLAADGTPDLESPLCMDMELLNDHFTRLSRGEKVYVPKFDFSHQRSVVNASRSLRLGPDDIAVFEGIHALNDDITQVHPEAFKLYISARANVVDDDGKIIAKGTWMRLIRRTIRDYLFRGAEPESTIRMWANVRYGEKAYINPFKDKADYQFDTAFPYEISVMNDLACMLFETIPEDAGRLEELQTIRPTIQRFTDIAPALVAPDAMIREFIGGGIYAD